MFCIAELFTDTFFFVCFNASPFTVGTAVRHNLCRQAYGRNILCMSEFSTGVCSMYKIESSNSLVMTLVSTSLTYNGAPSCGSILFMYSPKLKEQAV